MHAMHPMLNMAIRAARKAGDLIFQAASDVTKIRYIQKSDQSFVTQTDQLAQERILDTLSYAYPDHIFISEEDVDHAATSVIEPAPMTITSFDESNESDESMENTSKVYQAPTKNPDYVWYIDPIDGTSNFIHGFPHYAVSIALTYKGVCEHAVIYQPQTDELFYASKGSGAYLNNRRLRVTKRQATHEYLMASNLWLSKNHPEYLDTCTQISQQVAGLRRTGCTALDLAYVASGRLDAFFGDGLLSWDAAAGILLVQEAGGFVGNFAGDKFELTQTQLVAGASKPYAYLISHMQRKKV